MPGAGPVGRSILDNPRRALDVWVEGFARLWSAADGIYRGIRQQPRLSLTWLVDDLHRDD